jgi:hypothetical protein
MQIRSTISATEKNALGLAHAAAVVAPVPAM